MARLPVLDTHYGCIAAIEMLSLVMHTQSEEDFLERLRYQAENRQHAQAQGCGPADLRAESNPLLHRDLQRVSACEA
jgi:hypothetical protein